MTPFGAGLGLTNSDVNGNASHNVFDAPFGLDIVDIDQFSRILTLTGRGQVTPCGIDFLLLEPVLSFNPVGSDHTVTATLSNVIGDPDPAVPMTFSVSAGPNTGASGTCTPNADCTTDGAGKVSFSYTGIGGVGVDTIEASFINDAGEVVTSEPALKFWDEDCNDNGVPDTCDIDCSGFGDMCTEFQSFGRSLDLGDDGIPDECDPCQAAESLKMAALAALEGPDPDLPWAIKMLRTAIGIEEQLRGEAGTRLQLSSAGFWLWRASLLEQIVVKQLRWMQSFDSPRIREMFLRSARQLLDVSLSNLRSGCERL